MHARHGRALAQRDGSRYVQHLVNLGACRLADAAACVGGERFQVAAASLRIQHAQRKRALAGPGNAGDADHLMQWDVDVDVLQVVDACAAHLDIRRLAKDEPANLAPRLFVCVRHSGPSDKSNTRGICFILPPTLHFLLTFTQRQSAGCLSKMRLDRDRGRKCPCT